MTGGAAHRAVERLEELYPGVWALGHDADLAFEAEGATLEQLFDRAAQGMMVLLQEAPGAGPAEEERALALEADDAPALLAAWLRELLYLYEAHGLEYRGAGFEEMDGRRMRARVWLGRAGRPAVRELKGVTYHALTVERGPAGWRAQVVFDV